MIILIVAVLLLQTVGLIALFWFRKQLASLYNQEATLKRVAERMTESTEALSPMAENLHGIALWTGQQNERQTEKEASDNHLRELYSERQNNPDGELPTALITEALLANNTTVATAIMGVIDQAYEQINESIKTDNFRQSEIILTKLRMVLDRHLSKCPWNDLANLYKRAQHLSNLVDEAANTYLKTLSDANEAVAKNIPERLLLLCFPLEEIRSAQETQTIGRTTQLFTKACNDIAEVAAGLDPKEAHASLKLNRLELRFAQLLSSNPSSDTPGELFHASDAIRILKIKCQFYQKLGEAKITEAGIKAAFDRISSARSDLAQDILHGYVFEEIDKAMFICGTYLAISAELNTSMFDEACNALPTKEFMELRGFINQKQNKAYNSWAIWLITETKIEFKKKETWLTTLTPTMIQNKRTPIVNELFPKVFNYIDETMLIPGVSRLYYELQHKLIEFDKENYGNVRDLINNQLTHPKVTIYKLND